MADIYATSTTSGVEIGKNVAISSDAKLQTKTVSPSTSQQTIIPDSGYEGLSSVTVNAIQTETKTVALSMASGNQVITPSTNKYLTNITITKPATLIAGNIKKDIDIGGVIGTFEGGGGGGGATVIEASSTTSTTLTFTGSSGFTKFAILFVSNTGYAAASQVYGIYTYTKYDTYYRAVYYMSYGGSKFNFTRNSSPDEVKRSGDNFTVNTTYSGLGLGWITNSSQGKYIGFFWN